MKTNWKEELGPPLLGSGGHMKEPGLKIMVVTKSNFFFKIYLGCSEENRLEQGELKARSR